MIKEKTIKIRMSDTDMEMLQKCCTVLNASISDIVRLGIQNLFNKENENRERNDSMKNLIYAERVIRKDTGFEDLYTWDYEGAKENIIHLIDEASGEAVEEKADEILASVAEGKPFTVGNLYVSTFNVATPHEIALASSYREAENKKLDKMEMPEVTRFMDKLMNK